jgi:hypothetical protein
MGYLGNQLPHFHFNEILQFYPKNALNRPFFGKNGRFYAFFKI